MYGDDYDACRRLSAELAIMANVEECINGRECNEGLIDSRNIWGSLECMRPLDSQTKITTVLEGMCYIHV